MFVNGGNCKMMMKRGDVRGTAFASKASLELPRKPVFGWPAVIVVHPPAGARRFSCRKNERGGNGDNAAQSNQAAVRSASTNGFAKQTEKGAWKMNASLLADQLPTPFSTRLPRLKTQPTSRHDRFSVSLLTQKRNVLPCFTSPTRPSPRRYCSSARNQCQCPCTPGPLWRCPPRRDCRSAHSRAPCQSSPAW